MQRLRCRRRRLEQPPSPSVLTYRLNFRTTSPQLGRLTRLRRSRLHHLTHTRARPYLDSPSCDWSLPTTTKKPKQTKRKTPTTCGDTQYSSSSRSSKLTNHTFCCCFHPSSPAKIIQTRRDVVNRPLVVASELTTRRRVRVTQHSKLASKLLTTNHHSFGRSARPLAHLLSCALAELRNRCLVTANQQTKCCCCCCLYVVVASTLPASCCWLMSGRAGEQASGTSEQCDKR